MLQAVESFTWRRKCRQGNVF